MIEGGKREQIEFCGPGQEVALGQGVWCPEGDIGTCIIVYQLLHHGEVEWR